MLLSLHPAKEGLFFKILVIRVKKIKLKIISKNACENKKNSYFCTRFENESVDKKKDTFLDILN